MKRELTQLRVILNTWLEKVAMDLNLQDKTILEIGIGGDEKPSGSYQFFGQGNKWKTMDINPKWKPDITADICDSGLEDESFDMVIMTQTLEHIWDYKKALSEIYRITKEYAIIDCPFMFPFHCDRMRSGDSWENWDDFWRFTPVALKRLLGEVGFKKVDIIHNEVISLAVCKKYLSQEVAAT